MLQRVLASLAFIFSSTLMAQPSVVLVPGFFNSFAPEYFSQAIINTFEQKGYKTYVVEGLDPIGTIEENGEKLIPLLQKITQAEGEAPNIVAHSAGGFYSLYAINKGQFKVKNLVTVSTPYEGLDFIQAWRDKSSLFSELMNFCKLEGLRQLTPPYVAEFMKKVRVPDQLQIFTFGGWQPRSLDIWNAKNLSGVLRVTDHFIPGDSDGIVSFKSSLGIRNLLTRSNKSAKMYVDPNYVIPLEHWEQVLDYRNFVLLGTRNIDVVRDRQVQFFSGIADLLTKHQ